MKPRQLQHMADHTRTETPTPTEASNNRGITTTNVVDMEIEVDTEADTKVDTEEDTRTPTTTTIEDTVEDTEEDTMEDTIEVTGQVTVEDTTPDTTATIEGMEEPAAEPAVCIADTNNTGITRSPSFKKWSPQKLWRIVQRPMGTTLPTQQVNQQEHLHRRLERQQRTLPVTYAPDHISPLAAQINQTKLYRDHKHVGIR